MAPRSTPDIISKILAYDTKLTKNVVSYLLRYPSIKTIKTYGVYLEFSCHGLVWIVTTLAFIWIFDSRNMYQFQLNLLLGLILDILLIAVSKAYFRRRRPIASNDILTIGPDKFSFPSGHASRAMFILMFFIFLHPISFIWWCPLIAWTVSVSLSRLLLQRHYLLDVSVGLLLGIIESLILSILWISEDVATGIINYVSYDNLPGGPE